VVHGVVPDHLLLPKSSASSTCAVRLQDAAAQPGVVHATADGRSLTLGADPELNRREIAKFSSAMRRRIRATRRC